MNAELNKRVVCAYCGQSFDLVVEAESTAQELIVDCEVCCRPLRLIPGGDDADPVVEPA